MKVYVIHSEALGVFLGLVPFQGQPTGLWSQFGIQQWVPAYAAAFMTAESAYRLADQFVPPPLGLTVVPVEVDEHDQPDGDSSIMWASVEACTAAGLRAWLSHGSETINTVPT